MCLKPLVKTSYLWNESEVLGESQDLYLKINVTSSLKHSVCTDLKDNLLSTVNYKISIKLQ